MPLLRPPRFLRPAAAGLSALLLLAAAPAAAAELGLAVAHDGSETTLAPPAPPTAPPISLDVQDADIRGVLRLLAEHGGVNFVLDESVQGRVTARLEDVPWDQALAAILLTRGLVAVPMQGEDGAPPAVWVVQPVGGG